MSYPPRLLDPGEQVVVDVRPHGWVLAPPVAVVTVAVVGAAGAVSRQGGRLLDGAAGIVLVVALAWLVVRYLRWARTALVITTGRVVWRRGLVVRRQTDIPLSMVRDVQVSQSIGQRVLGAGDLTIDSGGAEERFTWVGRPATLRRELWRQVDAGRRRGPSVVDELDRLDGLRRRGVLSDVEFEAEKSRLLRR